MITIFQNFRAKIQIPITLHFMQENSNCFNLTIYAQSLNSSTFDILSIFENFSAKIQTFASFQWLAGLITFLFPGLASHLRSSYMPIHVFFGLMIFISACATALLGITEKAIFKLG